MYYYCIKYTCVLSGHMYVYTIRYMCVYAYICLHNNVYIFIHNTDTYTHIRAISLSSVCPQDVHLTSL